MNKPDDYEAREFHVETKFQQYAKRPGGIGSDQAFIDDEMSKLTKSIPSEGPDLRDRAWMDAADLHCQRLADVAATMGYEFVSYVANNLCLMFDAIKQGADYRRDVMVCHLDALVLGRRDRFRRMKPEDVPELTDGLRRVLESAKTKARQIGANAKLPGSN